MTNKEIREFYGHNGAECRVVIKRNGEIHRYGMIAPDGSANGTSRDYDRWIHIADIDDPQSDHMRA